MPFNNGALDFADAESAVDWFYNLDILAVLNDWDEGTVFTIIVESEMNAYWLLLFFSIRKVFSFMKRSRLLSAEKTHLNKEMLDISGRVNICLAKTFVFVSFAKIVFFFWKNDVTQCRVSPASEIWVCRRCFRVFLSNIYFSFEFIYYFSLFSRFQCMSTRFANSWSRWMMISNLVRAMVFPKLLGL